MTSLGAAAPLQILVPQLICFALNNSSIALNTTKHDLGKIDRDMKKRNKILSRKVEELHIKLQEATNDNLQLQSQVYSLNGNLTRVTHQLQETKLQQLHLSGTTAADIVEQMAGLYEERDLYKRELNETVQKLREIQAQFSIIEDKLNHTEHLLNDTSYKFFYTNQIVDVLVPDRALLLTEAVSLGNTSLVIPLIRLGTDVSKRDVYGFVPLEWTALEGDADTTRELLQAAPNVNTSHVTALQMASRGGHAEVVQALLDAGADPDAANEYQNTPLHEASFYGHEEVARSLLGAGAMVDPRNSNNVTPLMFAAQMGHLPVVKVLVQNGADLSVRNKAGRTPQEEAQHKGKQDVSWWLAQQT